MLEKIDYNNTDRILLYKHYKFKSKDAFKRLRELSKLDRILDNTFKENQDE